MKKRLIALFLILALASGTAGVWAAGAGADDPLISLSYLRSTYKPQLMQAVSSVLSPAAGSGKDVSEQILMDQVRYKQGDALKAATGSELLVLAGTVTVSFSSGAVVNATAGSEVPSGQALQTNSRYIVGEDTAATFTIVSPTAVVSCSGAVSVTESTGTPDYSAMADALHRLTLFDGTGSGYAGGYDLEKRPTRAEGIVMFIRLIGEEDAALASDASHPFTDVPAWADPYVGYAYEKGYTNGMSPTKFGTSTPISAQQYVEFLLRALGYSSIDRSDLSGTLTDALDNGILTQGEYKMLTTSTLLRAHVVYLSYYALDVPLHQSSVTLQQKLISGGIFTAADLSSARAMVQSDRL